MKKVIVVLSAILVLLLLSSACGGGEEPNPFGVKSEVVTAATLPTALAFAPDGRLFFGELQTGNIRIVTPEGELLPEPFVHLEVVIGLEWGLTSLAFDPDFEKNSYVYAYFTQLVSEGPPLLAKPVIVRLTDQNNLGIDQKVIVRDMPENDPDHPGFNANGEIHFGPDGFLYATIGDLDAAHVQDPQDLSILNGKMLRVNKDDGSAAPDNPFVDTEDADPRVFAVGFREPFNFAFHPQTGQIYGTDNTAFSCEELNLITKGGNYGHPDIGVFPFADCQFSKHTNGIYFFTKEGTQPENFLSMTVVSGLQFVSGDVYPLLGDSLLVCETETELMRRVVLSGANLDQVLSDDVVVEDCKWDITVSPDGDVYYSNDIEIRRLVVQATPKE